MGDERPGAVAYPMVAFFDEVVDVPVDGVPRERPGSPLATVMT